MADLVIAVSVAVNGGKESIEKYMAALKIDTLDAGLDHEDYEVQEDSRKELLRDFASGWKRVGDEENWR